MKTKLLQNILFTVCTVFLFGISSITQGADRYSIVTGTGNWNATSTWAATPDGAAGVSIPVAGDVVYIQSGKNVTVTADAAATSITFTGAAATLTVNSGFTLTVSGAVILNHNFGNATACLITGSGTLSCASVDAGLNLSLNGSYSAIMTSTLFAFNISGDVTMIAKASGSYYGQAGFRVEDGTTSVGGQITSSLVTGCSGAIRMTGVTTGLQTGTLVLSGATPWGTLSGITLALNGTNATVEYNGASSQTIRNTTYTNLKINTGGTSTLGGSITVDGTLYMTKGVFALGGNTLTYGASASLNYNGTTLQTVGAEWPATFTKNVTITNNSASGVTLNADKTAYTGTMTVNGTFNFSTFSLAGSGAFTLSSGGTIASSYVTNSEGFGLSSNNTTGSIRVSGTRTLSTGGNYILNGSAAQNTGTNMPTTVNHLSINNSSGVTLSQGTTVAGTLTLTSGKLAIGANTLTLNGTVASMTAANSLTGSSSSNLTIGGIGPLGTLYFDQATSGTTNNFATLNLNRTSSGVVTLGNGANVSTTLTLTNGIITTGSNTITIASAGSISSASASSYIDGKLARIITGTSATSFPVGKGGNYRPVIFTYSVAPTSKTVTVEQFESGSPLSLASVSTTLFGDRYWNITQSAAGIGYTVGLNNSGLTSTGLVVILRREGTGTTTSNTTTFSTPNYNNSSSFSTTDVSNDVQLGETAFPVHIAASSGTASGDFTTVKAAFDKINDGTHQGSITITIIGNTTETASAVVNASGTGSANYSSINIYPTVSGITVTGNLTAPIINLNGADNVTIDGRLNASGSNKDLTITNTSTSSNSTTSTIQFINSAENNTVKYCTLKGSTKDLTGGIVFLSSSVAGNGNDGNIIDNNDITYDAAGRPVNAIFSRGSSGFENSGLTISNNNIYNFLNPGIESHGVFIQSYSTAMTITSNNFYETSSFVPTASVEHNAIRILNTSGGSFTISDNNIGGNTTLCGGSAWTKTNTFDNIFYAIYVSVANTPISSIQNNTIKNFAWANSGAATWAGIYIAGGSTSIGTTTANTVGSTSGTGSIMVTSGVSGANIYGINIAGSGTIDCQNNKIGSITSTNASTNASNIFGINKSSSGITTINYNTIGSSSTINSLHASSASTANAQNVIGINNTTNSILTISNNIIANLTNGTSNADVNTAGFINGIASVSGTITNNTIHDLTIANANNASNNLASVCGVSLNFNSTVKVVNGNTIYNLFNSYASFGGSVIGVYFSGNTSNLNNVSNNFIHSLSVTGASSTSASIYGIKINVGAATYSNNIINLGGNTESTIYGIFETGATSNNNYLYFNTIYLGGTPTSGALNSYALYSDVITNTRNFRNNIFVNARSNNGATGKHYSAYFNYGSLGYGALTLDFNNYYTSGTGGVLGYYNGADVTSLPLIPILDAYSMSTNPSFASPGGTTASNYIPSSTILAGTTIATVSNDYALTNRAGTPTIGAYEVTLNLNVDVYKAGVFQSSYLHLKDAFDKINAGTHTGALEIKIKANTTEIASTVINASGVGSANYTSINLYPTATGITITGNLAAPLIDLNGADNVTIDGRVNATGFSKDLVISNSNTESNSTIRFYGSAENNTIKYCTLKGAGNNVGRGIIFFSSASTGNGNDGNIIDNNNLTSYSANNRPMNVIYSAGATGYDNSENIISNNNIYDFLRTDLSSNGIHIASASINWTVSGNSLYETTSNFVATNANTYTPIRISTLSNHLVTNNYIGGREPQCGGAAWTITGNYTHYFCAIFANGGNPAATTIQSNIIKNINYTSVEDNPWDGIFINAGVINVTGNTIGDTTGTSSITITTPIPSTNATISGGMVTGINIIGGGSGYTTAPIITFSPSGSTRSAKATAHLTNGVVTSITIDSAGVGYTGVPNVIFDGQSNLYSTSHGMIKASTETVNILNNNIGSITTVSSSYYSHGFESVYVRGVAGTVTISHNLIGSRITANSIQTSSTALSSPQKQDVYGLYSSGIGTTVISNNIVANLHNAYTGVNSASRARAISTTAGSNTIENNTVYDISTASGQSSGGSSASVVGIIQISNFDGTTQTIRGNTIYNIRNTNPSANTIINGMYYAGPTTGTHTVSGNFIHSLFLSSSDYRATIYGIAMNSGVVTCANNIINIGGNTIGYLINGIWDGTTAGNIVSFYFNTVYIGGNVSSVLTSATAALSNSNNTSTRNYLNNIFYNARTGGTSGKHYAINIAGTASLTINYNDYFSASGTLGKILTLEKTDLIAWRIGTTQDVNSISANPNFAIAGGTSGVNYYTSGVLLGISGTGITTDYDGLTRSTTPKMGALEYNNYTWQGGTDTDFATASNWSGGVVPPDGADLTFAATPTNHCVLDQNRRVGDITNAQGTKKLVINGKQLTINGHLNYTNGYQIDATATSSEIIFAGLDAQAIPSAAFVNSSVANLTVNNSHGLTLNGDLTINKSIALVDGNFAIGPNTLTLNGVVTAMTGTVTGGSSTNMIIGGTGASISMPTFLLNNLTLNRASGINLYGNLTIVGSLALTTGTLNVGANTLTISGNSVTSGGGSIDASNSSATLSFNNISAITLPVSIFTGAINNLTINSTGGITASSDFSVNGTLNLQSANPSATKGKLDMGANTLTMGPSSTTIGVGDVTGIVKRTSFALNTPYTFGNKFTTINFSVGPLPTSISFKIILTASEPSWMTTTVGVYRYYDIIRDAGTYTATRLTLNLHYLDTELNSAPETTLDFFDDLVSGPNTVTDRGRSNDNIADNWVGLAGLGLPYVANTSFDYRYWTLGARNTGNTTTWISGGAVLNDWTLPGNWNGGVPTATSDVVIPSINIGIHADNPTLPTNTTINTLNILVGGVLNALEGTPTLTLAGGTGAWENAGTFNAGTSTVIFANANATMADPTNFYNVTVADGASLSLGTNNIMRIAGEFSLSNTGILNAAINNNTIEYNGSSTQNIINPNGSLSGYYNLILSGSGTKTLPAVPMSIYGNLTITGTAVANADESLAIQGNLTIENGSAFNTNNFNHSIGGNFENFGNFEASIGNTITMNGTSAQTIGGSVVSNFNNLTIDNISGVTLLENENETNILNLNNGNLNIGSTTFGINGTINKTNGFLNVSSLSSLSFEGTSALTISDNLFANTPSLNNLTINQIGGVTLGNQDMTVNGLLNLTSGTLNLGANTLTINGNSPTKTSGVIDASNTGATLIFSNPNAILLPADIFSGNVNNLSITGTGGVTASSDFSINGVLNLQNANPSAIKGSLDMETDTLTMGALSTTIGISDVTGYVKRTSFVVNTPYTFGSQYTTINFMAGGTLPNRICVNIVLTPTHTWKSTAINRYYDISQSGGNSSTLVVLNLHYLDDELNGATKSNLDVFDYHVSSNTNLDDHGRSNDDIINNWVGLTNRSLTYMAPNSTFPSKYWTLGTSSSASFTWLGANSSDWTDAINWVGGVPHSLDHAYIPDASTTVFSPTIPDTTSVGYITIQPGGILNATTGTPTLTIKGSVGAWDNMGTFNPGTSSVIFTNANATISDPTNFFNITIASGAKLTLGSNNIMRIAGALTLAGSGGTQGVLNAAVNENTIEFNGSSTQIIPNPNGSSPGYHNLIINNSSNVSLSSSTTVNGTLTFTNGVLSTGSNTLIIPSGGSISGANISTGHVYGNLQKNVAIGNAISRTFEIGDATSANYEPIELTFASVSVAGDLIATTASSDHVNIASTNFGPTYTVNRTWTMSNSGITFSTYDCIFTWVSNDQDASFVVENTAVGKYFNSSWTFPQLNGTPLGYTASIKEATTFGDYQIGNKMGGNLNGNFSYYNLANTSLSALVSVGLYTDDNCTVQAATSSTNPQTTIAGAYEFNNLNPGTYYIKATSATSTDVAVNGTDAAQVNNWGVHPYEVERVRFLAGDVAGGNSFLSASDAQRIQKFFVNGLAFDTSEPWTFWKVAETTAINAGPDNAYPSVILAIGQDNTTNMYGLCMGDFNRSFNPNIAKTASTTLDLIYANIRQVNSNQEFELPLHMVNANSVGAVSLILNFPSNLVDVKDVLINSADGQLSWAVNGNELRIAWYSQNPIDLGALANLITLRLKTTNAFINNESISFALAGSPLNELADGQYEVINDAVLSVDVINASILGITEQTSSFEFTMSNYPNPFNNYTTFNYTLPSDGKVSLEIRNLLGETILVPINETQTKGDHTLKVDASGLVTGIYMATIKLSSKSDNFIRTIKLVKNR